MSVISVNLQTGEVTTEEQAPRSFDSAAAKAQLVTELRGRRDTALNVLDGLQSDALADGDTVTAQAIKQAKQACRDMTALAVESADSETAMRALYLAEWRRIALIVPASVRTSFSRALS